jgi:hypothetical protein
MLRCEDKEFLQLSLPPPPPPGHSGIMFKLEVVLQPLLVRPERKPRTLIVLQPSYSIPAGYSCYIVAVFDWVCFLCC